MRVKRSLSRRARSPLRARLAVATIVLLQMLYVVACVDGVTPDCSDAAARCDPSLGFGSAFDRNEAQPLPEASRPDTADADSAVPDAPIADADAGDGG